MEITVPQVDSDDWTLDELLDPRIAYKNISQFVKVKNNIRDYYHSEFLYSLMNDATHIKGRYLPVKHQVLEMGDTVLVKDPFIKSSQYPLGIITKLTYNDLNEVTQVSVRKANRSIITRDVSDIILLISGRMSEDRSDILDNRSDLDDTLDGDVSDLSLVNTVKSSSNHTQKRRKAAVQCEQKNKAILEA
jgi:hypothetical protein